MYFQWSKGVPSWPKCRNEDISVDWHPQGVLTDQSSGILVVLPSQCLLVFDVVGPCIWESLVMTRPMKSTVFHITKPGLLWKDFCLDLSVETTLRNVGKALLLWPLPVRA